MKIVQSIYSIPLDQYPNIFILTDHAQSMNVKNFNHRLLVLQVNEYKTNGMKLIDLQFSRLSDEFLRVLIREFDLSSSGTEEIVLRSNDQIIEKFIPEYPTIEFSKYPNSQLMKTEIVPKLDTDRVHFQLDIPKSREKLDL